MFVYFTIMPYHIWACEAFLKSGKATVLPNTPHSPDLAPRDFFYQFSHDAFHFYFRNGLRDWNYVFQPAENTLKIYNIHFTSRIECLRYACSIIHITYRTTLVYVNEVTYLCIQFNVVFRYSRESFFAHIVSRLQEWVIFSH